MSLISKIIQFLKTVSFDLVKSTPNILDWMIDVARSPLRLFSTNPPLPRFDAVSTKADLDEDLRLARASQEAVRTLDPTGIDTVKRFCMSPKHVRDTADLSVVSDPKVRALLITMDDLELKALATAGPGPIRKFILGQPHGVHGVPTAGIHTPTPANDERPTEKLDHRLWKLRAKLEREQKSAGFSI